MRPFMGGGRLNNGPEIEAPRGIPLNRPMMGVPASIPGGPNPNSLGRSFQPVMNPAAPTVSAPIGVAPGRSVM